MKKYIFNEDWAINNINDETIIPKDTEVVNKNNYIDDDSGKLIYATETRKCSECKNFVEVNTVIPSLPVCTKKLMGVTKNMHVYYEIEKGTCFELK